jgi:[ribosomal protein S18]-alanine N-acetyltransferase
LVDRVSGVTYRHMELEDLDQVREIDRLSFSLPWPPTSYRFEIRENLGSILWVAESTSLPGERTVVGMIVVWMIMDEAHIATIAVHPDYRGRRIGRGLLAVALKEAIQKGAVESTLEVRANNFAAQAVYREFGYQVTGLRPQYYKDNQEDAVLMTLHTLDDGYSHWLDENYLNQALLNRGFGRPLNFTELLAYSGGR